jgi:hypothetical protein
LHDLVDVIFGRLRLTSGPGVNLIKSVGARIYAEHLIRVNNA